VVENTTSILWQISCWIQRWKNFENPQTFGKVMNGKYRWSFLIRSVVCNSLYGVRIWDRPSRIYMSTTCTNASNCTAGVCEFGEFEPHRQCLLVLTQSNTLNIVDVVNHRLISWGATFRYCQMRWLFVVNLNKLNNNVNCKIIKWIAAFIENRKLRAKVKAEFSDSVAVLSGVPQGSVLGLLFLIFINDLPQWIRNSMVLIYLNKWQRAASATNMP